MMSSVNGLNILTGGGEDLEPDIETFERMAEDCILKFDQNADGSINFEEFRRWARTNRDLIKGIEIISAIGEGANEDMESEDSAVETDEEYLSDKDVAPRAGDQLALGNKTQSNADQDVEASSNTYLEEKPQWISQTYEPTNYKKVKYSDEGPDTNLELKWAHGYSTANPSSLRYVGYNQHGAIHKIVSYTARLGLVNDFEAGEQQHYMEHRAEISCMTTSEGGDIVATGDKDGQIHLWNPTNLSPIVIIDCTLSGVKLIELSPKADRLAVLTMDEDQTILIYTIPDGELVSSAKGLVNPTPVYDMTYSPDGTELVLIGEKQIKFYGDVHTIKRTWPTSFAHIGSSGKKQTFYCATYFKKDLFS